MKVLRLEQEKITEIVRMDRDEVNDELAQVNREIAKLIARQNHLEIRRDHFGDDPKTNAAHTGDMVDLGPREKFLADTKNMHMSEVDRALGAG